MTTRRPIRAILFALLCAGAPLITAGPAQATTFPVGCGPSRVAELVTAVDTANANGAGSDTVTLAAGCTYTFTAPNNHWYGPNALPAIASAIIIEGNGAVIERDAASPKFRLFYVGADLARAETLNYTTPGAGDLTLRNLTVRGGLAKGGDSGYGGGGAGMGGAVFNQGRVILSGVTMTANTARGGSGNVTGGYGGGGIGTDVGGGGGNGGGFGPGSFGGSVGGTTATKAGGGGGGFRPTDNGSATAGEVAGAGGGPADGSGGGGGRGLSTFPGALGGNGAGGRCSANESANWAGNGWSRLIAACASS